MKDLRDNRAPVRAALGFHSTQAGRAQGGEAE